MSNLLVKAVQSRRIAHALVLAVISIQLFAAPARADWINLTGAETAANIAEIVVLDDRVTVRLEIYVNNLEPFADLMLELEEIELADGGRSCVVSESSLIGLTPGGEALI